MKKNIFCNILLLSLFSFSQEIKIVFFDSLNKRTSSDFGYKKVVYEKINDKFKITTFERGYKTSVKTIIDTTNFAKEMNAVFYYKN